MKSLQNNTNFLAKPAENAHKCPFCGEWHYISLERGEVWTNHKKVFKMPVFIYFIELGCRKLYSLVCPRSEITAYKNLWFRQSEICETEKIKNFFKYE